MIKEILAEAEDKMKSTISVLEEDLRNIRSGRASTSIVDKITVEYYGTPTPLQHMANLSVPEAQSILIRPFDKSTLQLIEKAILASDIGLTPNNDGTAIRINLPPLTQERRKELVKQVSKRLEDSKVSVRNIRRSAISDIQDVEKEKMASQDEAKAGEENAQKLTDKYIAQIDDIGKKKEQEIMDF